MSTSIIHQHVEFQQSAWFRLLSPDQRHRWALSISNTCTQVSPGRFSYEGASSPFRVCTDKHHNHCRQEYVLNDGLPVPLHVCTQEHEIDHRCVLPACCKANCVDIYANRIIIIDSMEAFHQFRCLPLRTVWEAIELAAHESANIQTARGHAVTWVASTSGLHMHVRSDDLQDRILSPSDHAEASELHSKAVRLLTELTNPDGYIKTLDDVLEAREMILSEL